MQRGHEELVVVTDVAFEPVLGVAQEGMRVVRATDDFAQCLAQDTQGIAVNLGMVDEIESGFLGKPLFRRKMLLEEFEKRVEFVYGDITAFEAGRFERLDTVEDLFMLGVDFRQIDQQSLR